MSGPILVTGLPRSGTSLTAGILALCGAWTGPTKGATPENQKGSFENELLKHRFNRTLLHLMGFDPLGLTNLPPPGVKVPIEPPAFRALVLEVVQRQGWDGATPWLFKDAKTVLLSSLWRAAFPEARWVFVERPLEQVVGSCLRADPMTRRLGVDPQRWKRWGLEYRRHLEALQRQVNVERIRPESDILRETAGIEALVERLGLTWRARAVADFIEPRYWHAARAS